MPLPFRLIPGLVGEERFWKGLYVLFVLSHGYDLAAQLVAS